MLLSTQTDVLGQRHGDEEAIRIIAGEGFDAYDFSFFQMFSKNTNYWANRADFRETAAHLRAVADKAGIVCNQAHAPFASSTGDEARDEQIFQSIVQSMEAASILGARNIVVHPKQHLAYATNAKELWKMNVEFYHRLVPYCEKFHIHVACENMWQYSKANGSIIDSVCSRPDEFKGYLDDIDSPWIVACLDIGHVALTDEDLPYFVRVLGKKHLQALHIHDNSTLEDTHTLPFTHKLKYDGFFTALAEIGYEGDFTFEADNFLKFMPEALEADALHLMYQVGRYGVEQIQSQRK